MSDLLSKATAGVHAAWMLLPDRPGDLYHKEAIALAKGALLGAFADEAVIALIGAAYKEGMAEVLDNLENLPPSIQIGGINQTIQDSGARSVLRALRKACLAGPVDDKGGAP